jgi:flagellar assembly protein FliH
MPLPVFEEQAASDEALARRHEERSDEPASHHDAEERLREEFKAGFDEGRRHAERTIREEFQKKNAEMQAAIDALMESIARQYKEFQTAAEHHVVRLAVAIAERIVKRTVALDHEVVLRHIHEAMKRVVGVDRIRIRINPADEEFIRAHRAELLTSADAVRELTLEADETIARGSCVLESDAGNVDASITTQLERIEAALFNDQETR